MNADEKKLLRKFVMQEADKATGRLDAQTRYWRDEARKVTTGDTDLAADAFAAWRKAVESYNAAIKGLKKLGYTVVDDSTRYGSTHDKVATTVTLGLRQEEVNERLAKVDKAADVVRRKLDETVRESLLEIVAGDLPGIREQMSALREALAALVPPSPHDNH